MGKCSYEREKTGKHVGGLNSGAECGMDFESGGGGY